MKMAGRVTSYIYKRDATEASEDEVKMCIPWRSEMKDASDLVTYVTLTGLSSISKYACCTGLCRLSCSIASFTLNHLRFRPEIKQKTKLRMLQTQIDIPSQTHTFSHLELSPQTSNKCSLKTVMLCKMFANIGEH